jgi:hypothetical protein
MREHVRVDNDGIRRVWPGQSNPATAFRLYDPAIERPGAGWRIGQLKPRGALAATGKNNPLQNGWLPQLSRLVVDVCALE